MKNPTPRILKIDDFSFVRHVLPLFALVGKLYSAWFREKKPHGPIFVEFESGGKWYRTEVTNQSTCREILGQLWLTSHAEKQAEQRIARRADYAAKQRAQPSLKEHCKTASRVVKTWPKWKQGLLGDKS